MLRLTSRVRTLIAILAVTALYMSGSVGPNVAQADVLPATQADVFVDGIGVNSHFNWIPNTSYDTYYTAFKSMLGALGVRHIRDGSGGDSPTAVSRINSLNTAYGIKMITIVGDRLTQCSPSRGPLDLSSSRMDTTLANLKTKYQTMIEAIEGPNEYDLNHDYSGTGCQDPNWGTTLASYMQLLRSRMDADPFWATMPLIAPSIGHRENTPSGPGDLSSILDYGNIHSYPGCNAYPNAPNYLTSTDGYIPMAQLISGTKPIWSTETGYTDKGLPGECTTPAANAGRWTGRLQGEHFLSGVGRTYRYEFGDFACAKGILQETTAKHWGIIDCKGVAKSSYTSLKDTITLLTDPGAPFTPGSLTYSVTGSMTDIHRMTLQKRNGDYYAILWQEVSTLGPPDRSLTLTLGSQAQSVTVYKPYTSGTSAVSSFTNVTSFGVTVPDHLTIIKIDF